MENHEIHDLALGIAMYSLEKNVDPAKHDYPVIVKYAHAVYRDSRKKIESQDANITEGNLDPMSLLD